MASPRKAPSLTLTALIGGITVCFALGLLFLRAMRDNAERAEVNIAVPETKIRLVDNSGSVTAVVSWKQAGNEPVKDFRLQKFTVDGSPPKDKMPRQIPPNYEGRSIRLDFPAVPSRGNELHRVQWTLSADGNVLNNSLKLAIER